MLDNKGFDLWADDYDKSVGLSDDDNCYPFAGYKEILNQIYNEVLSIEAKKFWTLALEQELLPVDFMKRESKFMAKIF